MPLLADYLHALSHKRASGHATDESSYYGPLEALLDAAGAELQPRVHAVGQLKNTGAGHPDFGLFTAGQLAHVAKGTNPARGVVEVKGTDADFNRLLDVTSTEGKQVERYRQKYGTVLVTNYRQFALIATDSEGRPELRERLDLASSEAAFWKLAGRAADAEADLGVDFEEFITRALRHNVPITEPWELAQWLASYAKQARQKLERADIHRLDTLRESLEVALGISFSDERGRRFSWLPSCKPCSTVFSLRGHFGCAMIK